MKKTTSALPLCLFLFAFVNEAFGATYCEVTLRHRETGKLVNQEIQYILDSEAIGAGGLDLYHFRDDRRVSDSISYGLVLSETRTEFKFWRNTLTWGQSQETAPICEFQLETGPQNTNRSCEYDRFILETTCRRIDDRAEQAVGPFLRSLKERNSLLRRCGVTLEQIYSGFRPEKESVLSQLVADLIKRKNGVLTSTQTPRALDVQLAVSKELVGCKIDMIASNPRLMDGIHGVSKRVLNCAAGLRKILDEIQSCSEGDRSKIIRSVR